MNPPGLPWRLGALDRTCTSVAVMSGQLFIEGLAGSKRGDSGA
jgi:hypothetical protein